jgi:hypothetical protein
MSKTKRKWIVLDYNSDGSLRAEDVPYSATESIKDRLDTKSWDWLVASWTAEPTLNAAITGGEVYDYTYGGTTYYRFVPDPYDPTEDKFYSAFSNPTLSGLVATRGQSI